jgi:DNA-binding response OmpR family regulator
MSWMPNPAPVSSPNVLFIDDDSVTASLAPTLRNRCTVAVASTVDTARQLLGHVRPTLVIMDIDIGDGSAVDVCRQAKSLNPSPAVLVITAATQKVPDALAAGCDSVLLKPFPPNLFYGRVGRLLRAYTAGLSARADSAPANSHHLSEQSAPRFVGTNRVWPATPCPHCDHIGVTSFEFASLRQEWYACLRCTQVWVAECRD